MRSNSFAPERNIEIKSNAIASKRQRREDGGKPAVNLQIDDSIDFCAWGKRVENLGRDQVPQTSIVHDVMKFVEEGEKFGKGPNRRGADENKSHVRIAFA